MTVLGENTPEQEAFEEFKVKFTEKLDVKTFVEIWNFIERRFYGKE